MTSAVTTAVASIQTKHNSNMFSLRKMIEKSPLVRESLCVIFLPDLDAILKAHPVNNTQPKTEQ